MHTLHFPEQIYPVIIGLVIGLIITEIDKRDERKKKGK